MSLSCTEFMWNLGGIYVEFIRNLLLGLEKT